jgi:DNA-directed RNA polymerase specialized sigma24 family protein
MRRRLAAYFDRKRCLTPDELADETLTRVARRLEEAGAITDTSPARYCYIVAKFVFLEHLRRADRGHMSLNAENGAELPKTTRPEPDEADMVRLDCLERCLSQLSEADRQLILDYYRGDHRVKIEQRRALAARLELTPNALSIRACRIREKLETCVKRCTTVR